MAVIRVAGQEVQVEDGLRLHLALNQHGFFVETPCGARGACRKCRVKLGGQVPEPAPADREHLSAAELDLGFRLSCQHTCGGELQVSILPAAVPDPGKAAMGRLDGTVAVDPWAAARYGLALDLGSTTIVAALLDLTGGEELAAASTPNPQAMHGADLMARLSYAGQAPAGGREMQVLAVRAVNELTERLCRRAGISPAAIGTATAVGNTVMHHFFLGLPVQGLAAAPYVPAVTAALETPAAAIGLNIAPDAVVYTLPNVAGFVGADALAAALAAGIDETDQTLAVVDIGTNGECLLHHRGTVYAASAPAGPAFEGGEISQGMRANPGAIDAVDFVGQSLRLGIIKGAAPRGICGSGLLDAVAAMLRAGVLDRQGTLRPRGPLGRLVQDGSFRLTDTVHLTQQDVRQLQLAKGAIRAGLDTLLQVAGIGPADLDGILLAGAFGNYLRREAAIAIGLLPPVPLARVQPVGNAAAQGAKLVLLSRAARRRAEALAGRIRHLDLATHPDFEAIFMAALDFPAR